MKAYRVTLCRTEYFSKTFLIEADSKDQAYDMAWDRSGDWDFNDADEFTNQIEEITKEEV